MSAALFGLLLGRPPLPCPGRRANAAAARSSGSRSGFAGCYKPGSGRRSGHAPGRQPAAARRAFDHRARRRRRAQPRLDRRRTSLPPAARPGNAGSLLYVRFGRVRSEAKVEFRAADGRVTPRPFKTADAADGAHFLPCPGQPGVDRGRRLRRVGRRRRGGHGPPGPADRERRRPRGELRPASRPLVRL